MGNRKKETHTYFKLTAMKDSPRVSELITPKDKGHRRNKEAVNRAIHAWVFDATEIGTFYSKRGKRTYRGRQIN